MKFSAIQCAVLSWLAGSGAVGVAAQDTWETGDLMPSLSLVNHTTNQLSLCRPRNVDIIEGRPIPTNTWWGNLVTCDSSTNATMPIWPQPYAINVEMANSNLLYGFTLGYPFRYRYFGSVSDTTGVARHYGHVAHKEVLFSAVEFVRTVPVFRVADWSDLGVRLTMRLPTSSASVLQTNVVSGMAYFTATYTQLAPRIGIQVPIQSINGVGPVQAGAVFSGRRFILNTVSGLQWVLYTSSDVTFNLETNMVLRTSTPFTGTIRLAPVLAETPITMYDTYRDCIVQGGTVSVEDETQYRYAWQTTGDCSRGLLHFALPHHLETIDPSTVSTIAGASIRSTTRGEMRALVTKTSPPVWLLNEKASIPVTFYPRRRISKTDVSFQGIFEKLKADIIAPWSIPPLGSFYFTGKAAQKYASLCLMANDPEIVGSDVSVLRRCMTKLETVLAPYLDNSWFYQLAYDKIYGGIVSSESFVTGDMNADFGNSVYNDHHYHYGYWIFTAAVINHLHPTWNRIDDLNRMTRLLVRDVGTPTSNDPYFPKFRNYDWFRGHSYSHGVTTFADGKDQESTSEDINFSYGMYLFALTTGNQRMATTGKLMLKIQARAVQRYFLMESASTVHPDSFKPNKAPGILFDNKVDYATWFSAEKYCIHGIQMVPITPMTDFVRTRTFIQEEWATVLSKEPIVTTNDLSNAWLSLLYANYARVDKYKSMNVLQQVQLDDGLTRSWALYMAAQLF